MRSIIIAIAIAGCVFETTGTASAHAFLSRSTPAVGGTVHALPAEVTLHFTENVEPDFCTVQVVAPGGERIDMGAPHVEAGEGAVLHVPLKPPASGGAAAGVYKVV